MASQHSLSVENRTVIGKQVAQLRRAGITPANIFGRGTESVAIQTDTKALQRLLHTTGKSTIVELAGAGKSPVSVLIKGVSRDAVSGLPLHVDFYQVNMKQTLRTEVALSFTGESPAVADGGVLLQTLNSVQVEALPGDLPSSIEVDLSVLKDTGDSIFVKDLKAPKGVTILADGEMMIAKISGSQLEAEVEAEAEEAAEAAAEEAAAGEGETAGEAAEGGEAASEEGSSES